MGISSNWRPLVFSHWADLYYQYPQLSIQTPWLLTFLPLAETCVTALSPGSKTLVHEDLVALQDSFWQQGPEISLLSLLTALYAFSTSALPSLSSFPFSLPDCSQTDHLLLLQLSSSSCLAVSPARLPTLSGPCLCSSVSCAVSLLSALPAPTSLVLPVQPEPLREGMKRPLFCFRVPHVLHHHILRLPGLRNSFNKG